MSRFGVCLFVILAGSISFTGCVAKEKYVDLQSRYTYTQKQLTDEEERRKDRELKLASSENEKRNCLNELSALQVRYSGLEDQYLNIAREMALLKQDAEREKSTIEQQKRVITQLDETRRTIESTLKGEIHRKEIKLEELEGKLKVTFIDKILFNTGSAEINKRGQELILQIADSLKADQGRNIVVEGHTDNVPIGVGLIQRYATNWELSTARATAVVRFLQDKGGIEPERLSAAGYSYYQPVSLNDTEEGRSQNRRIEIILAPIHEKAWSETAQN
jgi:chemotaxis protein MotB